MVFGTNTGFGANTVCELFPHIHTEGFCCVHQGLAIFAMNLHAVCQPNMMQIHSDIVMNLHRVLCVKALSASRNTLSCILSISLYIIPLYLRDAGDRKNNTL